MVAKIFRVAMLNSLRIGPYNIPHQTRTAAPEWLIVSRSGNTGEFLTISDTASSASQSSEVVPLELSEQNSIVAMLAESSPDNPQFMVVRHLPSDIKVPGRFFPADGMAELLSADGKIVLRAFGRHAHSRGSLNGSMILHDIPDPAPNAEGAINWHFVAREVAWAQSR